MYSKTTGIKIETLVLPGGGTSFVSMYLGLLKDIDLDTLTFDLVLSSAGALWFAEVMCRKLQTQTESNERVKCVKTIHKELIEFDLVTILESEHETIFSYDDIERFRSIYSCLENVRIKDLKQLCNGRLIRFSVTEIKEDSMLYQPIIVDATNSPDALLFDVVLASCSLPIIFPIVSLNIDGGVRQCLDGELSDYVSILADDNYTVLRPRICGIMNLYNNFKTKIPLIDNLLKFVTSVLSRVLQKSWGGDIVFHDCIGSIHTPIWDKDFYKMGEKMFEEIFSLENPI